MNDRRNPIGELLGYAPVPQSEFRGRGFEFRDISFDWSSNASWSPEMLVRRPSGDAVSANRDRLCCRVASLLAGAPDLLDPIAAADVLDEVRRTIGNANPSASMRAAWKRALVARASAELAIPGEGRRGA